MEVFTSIGRTGDFLRWSREEFYGELESGIVATVAEHLSVVGFGVVDGDVDDVSLGIADGMVDGVDETFVGREVELFVAGEDFLVEHGVDLHAVVLYEVACCGIVALALDALDFGKEFAEEGAKFGVVVDADVGFAAFLYEFHHLVGLTVFVGPAGNEGTVAHVRLFDVVAGFDAHELRHESVHHVGVVLALVGFEIGCESEIDEFLVGHVIKAEEVGARFFDGRTVGFQCVGVGAGEEFSAAVAETFVEVGVEVVAGVAVLADELARGIVNDELFVHAGAVGRLVVGIGEVADGDALGTVFASNPVGVGKVDADGGGRIEVAAKDGSGDDFG